MSEQRRTERAIIPKNLSFLRKAEKIVIMFDRGDMDGMCSMAVCAFIWHTFLSEKAPDKVGTPIFFYPYRYQDSVDGIDLSPFEGAVVFIADVCPRDEIGKIKEIAQTVVYLDHHEQSEKVHNEIFDMFGIFAPEGKKAACQLAWEFGHRIGLLKYEEPWIVRMLGRYDMWMHNEDKDEVAVMYGAKSVLWGHLERFDGGGWELFTDVWFALLKENSSKDPHIVFMDEIESKGKAIYLEKKERGDRIAREIAFNGILYEGDGTERLAICANIGFQNSLFFDAVKSDKHEVMVFFQLHKSGLWKVSLFSNVKFVDVGKIARFYGDYYGTSGGGREGAAGFMSPVCPIDILREGCIEVIEGGVVV